jgi:hypothetical protein
LFGSFLPPVPPSPSLHPLAPSPENKSLKSKLEKRLGVMGRGLKEKDKAIIVKAVLKVTLTYS